MPNLPDPMTREQYYLKAIAEGASGGSSGGAGAITFVNIDDQNELSLTAEELLAAVQTGPVALYAVSGPDELPTSVEGIALYSYPDTAWCVGFSETDTPGTGELPSPIDYRYCFVFANFITYDSSNPESTQYYYVADASDDHPHQYV